LAALIEPEQGTMRSSMTDRDRRPLLEVVGLALPETPATPHQSLIEG